MEINNVCLVIVTTFLIFAGKTQIAAGKKNFVTLSKPFFSSNLKESKDLLKHENIIETELNDCPDKETKMKSTVGTEGKKIECSESPVDAVTETGGQQATKNVGVTTPQGAQSREPTKKDDEIRTLQEENPSPFTEKDTTVSATTSQVEATSVPSTDDAQSKAQTTKTSKMSTPLVDTTAVSSTKEESTSTTTTSQVQTTTTLSTQEDTTVATKTCPNNWPSPNTTPVHHDCPCWKAIGNTEYMKSNEMKNFNDSRQFCQACGGDIAVLNTMDVKNAIKNITNIIGDEKEFWIGIVRVQTEEELFEWLDCRDFFKSDSSWISGQPNNRNGQQACVKSVREYDWSLNDKRCEKDDYYVLCQRRKLDCGDMEDWKVYNNSCYVLNQTKLTWDDAVEACYSYKDTAHLVFIESDDENNFLKCLTDDLENHDKIWIGLNRQEDAWKWYNKTAKVQANGARALKKEDSAEDGDCAYLERKTDGTKWKWNSCTEKYFFICEVEK